MRVAARRRTVAHNVGRVHTGESSVASAIGGADDANSDADDEGLQSADEEGSVEDEPDAASAEDAVVAAERAAAHEARAKARAAKQAERQAAAEAARERELEAEMALVRAEYDEKAKALVEQAAATKAILTESFESLSRDTFVFLSGRRTRLLEILAERVHREPARCLGKLKHGVEADTAAIRAYYDEQWSVLALSMRTATFQLYLQFVRLFASCAAALTLQRRRGRR